MFWDVMWQACAVIVGVGLGLVLVALVVSGLLFLAAVGSVVFDKYTAKNKVHQALAARAAEQSEQPHGWRQ